MTDGYMVECIIRVAASPEDADPRPGWIRRMIGPFTNFTEAEQWMTKSLDAKSFDSRIIHPLLNPLSSPSAGT